MTTSFALLVLTAVFLLLAGGALLSLSASGRSMVGVELLAYSVGLGALSLAAIGVLTVSVSPDYQLNARVLLVVVAVLSAVQWWRRAVWRRLVGSLSAGQASTTVFTFAAWLVIACMSMAITLLPIRFPDALPDGAYVIKDHSLPVKVQVAMGDFPADNFIPFVAGEFLLRDIQFSEERPLMPGQELANRPILMSLAALPTRAALGAPQRTRGPLPKFRYVGQQWPDVASLGNDATYRLFLSVALVLNGALVLGAALLFYYFGLRRRYLLAGLVLIVTSPYFIGQTLFAWPKALAGFMLLLSAYTLLARQRTWVAGLFAALAYWAHPYALVFIGAGALYLLIRERNDLDPKRGLLPFLLVACAGVTLWIGWARWYLEIPSDLVAQNFQLDQGSMRRIQMALLNTVNTILPVRFWPLPHLHDLARASLIGLVGATGALFLLQAALGLLQCLRRNTLESLLLVVLPAALLVGVFSAPAIPAVHGFQALAVLLLALSLRWMQQLWTGRAFAICMTAQLLLNFMALVLLFA